MFLPEDFFDLKEISCSGLFSPGESVWRALDRLPEFVDSLIPDSRPLYKITGLVQKPLAIHRGEVMEIEKLSATGPKGGLEVFARGQVIEGAAVILPGAYIADDRLLVGAGSVVEPGVFLKGPTIIGPDCEVRQGAYIRGNCLVGSRCVVGHATEVKGSIMLDGAKAGHFAYIGDSILGREVNLGAGTKLANLRMIPGTIVIRSGDARYDTGRRKLGAILGDGTETGCNSVTSPGTLMGPRSIVYPALNVPGGYYPGKTIVTPSKGTLNIRSFSR